MTNIHRITTQGVPINFPPSAYTGRNGEVTIDPVALDMTIHDGLTPGGFPVGNLNVVGPLTAHPGGGPSGATPLTANAYHIITVVGSTWDSFLLPPAIANTVVVMMVIFNTTTALEVFASGSDTLNGVGGGDPVDVQNASVQFQPNALTYFLCATTGAWWSNAVSD